MSDDDMLIVLTPEQMVSASEAKVVVDTAGPNIESHSRMLALLMSYGWSSSTEREARTTGNAEGRLRQLLG